MHSRFVCRVQIRYKPINSVEVSWYVGVRVLLSSGGFVGLGVANNYGWAKHCDSKHLLKTTMGNRLHLYEKIQ